MADDLEDKVMDKKVSFSIKDMKWVVTTAVVAILWIVTAILWVKDKDAQADKIESLESHNSILEKQVATLEGKVEGVNQASKIFMENSPSENRFRIELVEKRIDILELPGSNPPPPVIHAIVTDTISNRREH
jgi:hypothetical protein